MFGLIKISRRKTVFSIAMICLISCVALAGHAATLEAVKRVLVLHSLGRSSHAIPPSIRIPRPAGGCGRQRRDNFAKQRFGSDTVSISSSRLVYSFCRPVSYSFCCSSESSAGSPKPNWTNGCVSKSWSHGCRPYLFTFLRITQTTGIVNSLGDVAQFLGFDFSSLSVFTGPAAGRVAFNPRQAPGTPAMPSNLTEKDFPWMARQLFAGRDVSFLRSEANCPWRLGLTGQPSRKSKIGQSIVCRCSRARRRWVFLMSAPLAANRASLRLVTAPTIAWRDLRKRSGAKTLR